MQKRLGFFINASFPGINRLLLSTFKNVFGRGSYKPCYLWTVEIKDYNVMTNGGNLFDQPMKIL